MNWKFLWRGTALALGAIGLGLLGLYLVLPRIFPAVPYGPTPPPPTIVADQGPQPESWPGLEAWARYSGEQPALAGSAFLFSLGDGVVVAATAAHSFNLEGGLEAIHLSLPGEPVPLAELQTMHGEPGRPRIFGANLTGDYLLLQIERQFPSEIVLMPDERGAPQPGERVVLYPGVGESAMEQQPLYGTILSVDHRGAWAVMDLVFEPAQMSGSPIFSSHTGRVVGMALAAGQREGHTVIGMHPIGSLLEKALAASEFPALSDFAR